MIETVFNFINYGAVQGSQTANTASSAAAPAAPSAWGSLGFILVFFILMYVMLILPQKRQEKKHKQMLSSLERGDKVLNQAGIIGKVVSINNDRLRIRTADKTELDVTRASIISIMSKGANAKNEEKEVKKAAEKEEK